MAGFVTVTAFSRCADDELPYLLAQTESALRSLGCSQDDITATLSTIESEIPIYGSGSAPQPGIYWDPVTMSGRKLVCLPHVALWTQDIIPDLSDQWASVEMLFAAESDLQIPISKVAPEKLRYVDGAGRALWQVARKFQEAFPASPVYILAEGENDEIGAWLALPNGVGNVWNFDAAIISRQLTHQFKPVPVSFASAEINGGIAFANETRWSRLPWDE